MKGVKEMENESFGAYLNNMQASRDVVQQALRYYVSERTEDLPVEEMHGLLENQAKDVSQLEQQLAMLEQSSDDLEDVALTYLAAAWADPAEREAIRAALQAANKALPVVETLILATMAMYGMYLLATRGRAREIKRVRRNKDGSFVEETETIYADPRPWVTNLLGLFRGDASPGQ
jgi:hypothetical protein